jgi:hypothetical protein
MSYKLQQKVENVIGKAFEKPASLIMRVPISELHAQ